MKELNSIAMGERGPPANYRKENENATAEKGNLWWT
jgi:hypothetical protein